MNRIYPCVLLMLFALSTIPVEANKKPHHLEAESDKSQSMSDDDEESTVTITSSASETEFLPEMRRYSEKKYEKARKLLKMNLTEL